MHEISLVVLGAGVGTATLAVKGGHGPSGALLGPALCEILQRAEAGESLFEAELASLHTVAAGIAHALEKAEAPTRQARQLAARFVAIRSGFGG